MAGAKKDEQDAAKSDAPMDLAAANVETPVPVSLAARRRRIEKLRERQELMALLDDFGDGDLDLELLEEDEDDEESRYFSSEEAPDEAEEVLGGDDLDDDDDYVDDEFDDDD